MPNKANCFNSINQAINLFSSYHITTSISENKNEIVISENNVKTDASATKNASREAGGTH